MHTLQQTTTAAAITAAIAAVAAAAVALTISLIIALTIALTIALIIAPTSPQPPHLGREVPLRASGRVGRLPHVSGVLEVPHIGHLA